ncbi:MAG: Ribonuclease J (endonuclease and 5' exonuclease) [uncultured Thermomicrobiales bacterium]|uniref:Ribonuclease J n=1 Tax=uncultured Thermomicrobiales bacterium TaxID=1645740 RepID=A0A6J4UEJ1_9BACT|nr:MAG: Ribonuclease J (endonuclease and 5' exonuclease) [uncultured Thermomicrobiales bacterium]
MGGQGGTAAPGTGSRAQRPGGSPGARRPLREEETSGRIDPRRAQHAPSGWRDGLRGREVFPDLSERKAARVTATGSDTPLRVIPLGGVGEVGKNMTLVEYGNDILLLDCGGKFPEEEQRGIDLVIPDVTYLVERLSRLRAILITHGHEDHIGGLPYILPQIAAAAPIPIYGSPLALGFIEGKLYEHRQTDLVDLQPVRPGERVTFGQLEAEFIHVTHSIPDTNAIAIHSPVGTIVDTADFKFDPTPVMGEPTDEARLRRLGRDGVLALFSDTVRVEVDGSTPSERVVLETMDDVIRVARGQVIIATFASNISRIDMALKAAEKYGRKVAVAGRSMEQNSRVAMDLGYLDPPEGLLIPLEEALKMPRERRVLVITGSQGEAAAALARIAAGEHPRIRVTTGDVALLSATPIPGNEETVTRTIDNLFRRGARVIYSGRDRGVHVSGHAGRDELKKMIDLLKPTFVIPIHGEFRHMVLYRELAMETGLKADQVMFPEIGGVLEFTPTTITAKGRIKSGSILVDRLGDRGTGQVTLRNRENIADDGVVVVTIVVDRETGKLIAGPDLVAKGLKPELQNGALKEAEQELRRTLERRSRGEVQLGHLITRSKETVGKALYRRSKSRPMILPVVTEL